MRDEGESQGGSGSWVRWGCQCLMVQEKENWAGAVGDECSEGHVKLCSLILREMPREHRFGRCHNLRGVETLWSA